MTRPTESIKLNISIVGFGQYIHTETIEQNISNSMKQPTEYYFRY